MVGELTNRSARACSSVSTSVLRTSMLASTASSTGRTVSTAACRLASLPRHREQVVRSRYRKSTSMVCLAPLTSSSGIFVVISVPPCDDTLGASEDEQLNYKDGTTPKWTQRREILKGG